MSRKINQERVARAIFCLAFLYVIVSISWWVSSDISVHEGTIDMFEWVDDCYEKHGPVEKCSKPIDKRKKSRQSFYRFQLFVIGMSLLIYTGYKLVDYFYPIEQE